MHYQIIPVTAFQQNCSLIWCKQTGACAFIDPGGDTAHLQRIVSEKQLQPAKIFLTHGHLDHVGGAQLLAQHYEIPMIGPHSDDRFWFDALPQQAEMFGFPPCPVFMPDSWLEDGETVTLGKEAMQVLHTPGHTPGHIVFWHSSDKLLFAGDVLFRGSIGRTDFPGGNHQQLLHAIRSKLFVMDPDTVVIPGHGPCTSIGQEQRDNPFVNT